MVKQKILEYTITDKEIENVEFFKTHSIACWSAKVKLPIAEKEVDVFFDTISIENQVTTSQKSFLEWIVNDFSMILNSILTVLPDELKNQYSELDSAMLNFLISALTIPDINRGQHKWDITFKIRKERKTYLIVYFENKQPISSYLQKDEQKWWIKLFVRFFNH